MGRLVHVQTADGEGLLAAGAALDDILPILAGQ